MSQPVRVTPISRAEDPAGLDKLLIATAKAAHDFVMAKAGKFGIHLDWWNGQDGLKAVLEDAIDQHKIPNKRFPELVTPRKIAERTGVIKSRVKKRRLGQ